MEMEEETDDLRVTRPSKRRRLAVLDSFPSPPSSLERRTTVNRNEVERFANLIKTDPIIQAFFLQDRCNMSCDRYNLACVFAYFKRADLSLKEYNRHTFFQALYLNLTVEDEKEDYRWELLPWCLGKHWRKQLKSFMAAKNELWQRMHFRAIVSMEACTAVLGLAKFKSLPEFHRQRMKDHVLLKRQYGHQIYDPIGPIWQSKAGRSWILDEFNFDPPIELFTCEVCDPSDLSMSSSNGEEWITPEARELFHKAAMLLDREWMEKIMSLDHQNEKVLQLQPSLTACQNMNQNNTIMEFN